MYKTLNVNLYASACYGKTTIAEATTSLLRQTGQSVELVQEYSKELHWRGLLPTTEQFLISAEQYRRQAVLQGQVAIVITDSAVPLGLLHAPKSYRDALGLVIDAVTSDWWSLNILLERDIEGSYSTVGRTESRDEAYAHQQLVRALIKRVDKDHLTLDVDHGSAQIVAAMITAALANKTASQ